MAVTRLDSFTLADAQSVTGVSTEYIGPAQFHTTFHVSGDATGLSIDFEAYDGGAWVPIDGLTGITANGSYTFDGATLGLRANVTAITGGAVTVIVVFGDPS